MDKGNLQRKKDQTLASQITILSLFLIIGVVYAFFSSTLSNANRESASVETATIALRFDDNDSGISGILNLGESIEKRFTLENTGTKEAYAKINWVNLVNTYMQDSLTYTLEQSTSANGTYTNVGSGNVPVSATATTKPLKNGILVPVNTTYYYKLTITLNNLENVNQNSDINASFSSYFGLEEGSLSGADTILNLVSGSPTGSTDVITKSAPEGSLCTNTLAYDGTSDNNLRYVGADPCNYVSFNDELWRIIGIMNNVDDGMGNLDTRIKLIRSELLGNYSWDTSDSSVNDGWGINDWTQADLMRELNGDYLDTTLEANTFWYSGQNNQKTNEFDYTKGLKAYAQNQISNAKWYLGGQEYDLYTMTPAEEITALKIYGYEKGNKVWGSTEGQSCEDGYCPRATSWTGKVALIYPSDYGFAVGGNNRNTCLIHNLTNYSYDNCYQDDWLNSYTMWTISPFSKNKTSSYRCSSVLDSGNVISAERVYPVVYLKASVQITGGSGSSDNPYILT